MDAKIPVSSDLMVKVQREADARGISLSEFVTQSLEQALALNSADDPLFSDDAVYRDQGLVDLAARHDDYLYGDAQ